MHAHEDRAADDTRTAAIAWMREALESGPDAQRAHAVVRSLVQRLDVWPDKQGFTLHYYLGNVGGAASLGGTPGAVTPKTPHLIHTLECAQRLTRRGNQHGVCPQIGLPRGTRAAAGSHSKTL